MPQRSFGRTVRYRRTKLGLSQAKLGELVGRSAATVRSWERDDSHPSDAKVLSALAAILGVDERTMFEKAGLQPPEVETSPTVEEALASLAPESQPSPAEEPEPDLPPAPPLKSVPLSDLIQTELRTPSEPSYEAPSEEHIVAPAPPPITEPSYVEDSEQRQLYRVRNLATLVVVVALIIALLWALSRGLESFGEWWDDFFGQLRL